MRARDRDDVPPFAGARHGVERGLVGIGPPAVAATIARGGRNLQRTHDAEAERRTAELWDSGG